MSTMRKSSCIVSGSACTQWIAAYAGMGSVKVASRRHATTTNARTQRTADRDRIMVYSGRECGSQVSLLASSTPAGVVGQGPAAEPVARDGERHESGGQRAYQDVGAGPREAPFVRVPHPRPLQRDGFPAPASLPSPQVRDRGHPQSEVAVGRADQRPRSEEHTSELQSLRHLVCRLLLEKKKRKQ